MIAKYALLLACSIALAGSLRVDAATITFQTETTTELTGTFLFTDSESLFSDTASIFLQLPGQVGDNFQRLFGERNATEAGVTVQFFAQDLGLPDDPYFFAFPVQAPTVFPEVVGTYINSPAGLPVNFRFYDLTESSGGIFGTFSGKFSFVVAGNPEEPGVPGVPDSGSTLTFLGLVLAGLGLLRRRSR